MFRLFLVFCLLSNTLVFGQIGTGQWRMHIAAAQAIDVATGNGLVMSALKTGVLEYDIAAGETKILNNLNGLSDITITTIGFEPNTKSFFVGYENGNIDQILSNGAIVNIPAIRLANIIGNKKINRFTMYNNLVFVSTGFAVVVIDPTKHEVKDTYYPTSTSKNFQNTFIVNDTIYALHNDGLLKANINNPLLANAANWQVDNRLPSPPLDFYFKNAAVVNNEIYVLYKKDDFGGDSILRLTPNGTTEIFGHQFNSEIINVQNVNGYIGIVFDDASLLLHSSDYSIFQQFQAYGGEGKRMKSLCFANDGVYYIADESYGLIGHTTFGWARLISREGPPKSEFFSINGNKGRLVVTSGTIDRIALNYSQTGAYSWQDETWKLYDQTTIAPWSTDVWALGSSAVNPDEDDEVAIGGYCPNGVTIIKNGVPTVYGPSNSTLEYTLFGSSSSNNMVCLPSMEYDEKGNLWVVNAYSMRPLKVRANDGTWYNMLGNASMQSVYASELAIDYNGNKWVGIYNKGLLGYKDNGSIGNTSDDTYRIIESGEGAGNLPSENITALAVDFDNEIWIGTDAGFAVLYNSEGYFTSTSIPNVSRILVEYEGNVEILLGNSYIADIEIDGGNRKWIGTGESGIFLLSADGQEVLANYTKENSPLISNVILDMEFNHLTGELFIITDNGMVSLRTDASYEDENYETTTVFPNPVKPDFTGVVTIQGIRYNSDVRITDAAGNLVYKTTSNGGTATWNIKTSTGEDVTSGVYFIWTATMEGKNKKVGKVVVIR